MCGTFTTEATFDGGRYRRVKEEEMTYLLIVYWWTSAGITTFTLTAKNEAQCKVLYAQIESKKPNWGTVHGACVPK